MGLSEWWAARRKKMTAEEIERARHRDSLETPEERRYTSGDIEGLDADRRAAELTGEPADEIERLGD